MMEAMRMELTGWVAVTHEGELKTQDGRPLSPQEAKDLAKEYRSFFRCSGPVPSC